MALKSGWQRPRLQKMKTSLIALWKSMWAEMTTRSTFMHCPWLTTGTTDFVHFFIDTEDGNLTEDELMALQSEAYKWGIHGAIKNEWSCWEIGLEKRKRREEDSESEKRLTMSNETKSAKITGKLSINDDIYDNVYYRWLWTVRRARGKAEV